MPQPKAAQVASAPVFSPSQVICRSPLKGGDELLEALMRLAAAAEPGLDAEAALKAVRQREAAAPTFLSPGVAMPHARVGGISRTLVAIATSASPEGFSFAGAEWPARLVVLAVAPLEAPAAYLRVAAAIARRLEAPGALDDVCSRTSAEDVAAFFAPEGVSLHGNVHAADLMEKPTETLRDTDSVKDAIDRIVATGCPEIPVVDKEGDLVGVASARALLRLCIPDYLLWMEDLSGFSDFQPFETLLRKESHTWLSDITDDDYASVQADGPAIAVAEAMARRGTDTCYVLDGARLVGVVTLPRFLHNVFRD